MAAQAKPTANRNGILKIYQEDDKNYYTKDDIKKLVGVSDSKAYRIIRQAREELISSGRLLSEYPAGRVPKKYLDSRIGND